MKNFIIESAIPAFRNFLVTDRIALSIIENDDTMTWESLMLDKNFKPKKILTVPSNKFEFENSMSIVHYLSPASTVAGLNLCRMASAECRKACLGFTGNLNFHVNKSYRDKTIALVKFTKRYLEALVAEIVRYIMIAISQGKKPYFRLNGLSDIPFYRVIDFVALDKWIKETAAQLGLIIDGPTLYDYSKFPVNQSIDGVYHVTYSYNENTRLEWLTRFDRVAFVLPKKDHKKLLEVYPAVFVDGNSSDIRPLDKVKYVLLPLKGKNEGETGFVLKGETIINMLGLGTGTRFERLITLNQLGFAYLAECISDGYMSFNDSIEHLNDCRRQNTDDEMPNWVYEEAVNIVNSLFLGAAHV